MNESSASAVAAVPVITIQPTRGLRFLDLRELWHYRELVYFLTWRNIKVRYKQTAIGVIWAVLQPLAMMVVFTIFFGKLVGLEDQVGGDLPYAPFAYAGLLPWQLFARVLGESSSSLVSDQRLVTKVYFPRIIVPVSSCVAAVVDFAIGAVLLFGLMWYYGVALTWTILLLPCFVLLMLMTAIGIGLWLSALNTEFRDVMYIVPFLVQFWMFVTPVVYPATIVPEQYRWLMGLNPMSGVIEGIRWSVLGYGSGPDLMFWTSVAFSFIVLVTGVFWFRWRERTFVDHLGGQ